MLHHLSEDCPCVRDEIMLLKYGHNRRRTLDAEDSRRVIEIGAHGDACRMIRIPRLLASGAYHNGGIGQMVASFAGLGPFGFHGAMVTQKGRVAIEADVRY